MNVKKRIREILKQSKDSQNEMARKTGLTKSAISQYVNGSRIPRLDAVEKICNAYQVSAEWLLGYEESKEKAKKKPKTTVTHHDFDTYQWEEDIF